MGGDLGHHTPRCLPRPPSRVYVAQVLNTNAKSSAMPLVTVVVPAGTFVLAAPLFSSERTAFHS